MSDMPKTSTLEIYLGGPIDNGSERMLLSALVDHLKTLDFEAVILANIFLPSRQVDLVVATAHGACVVEAKASRLPVRGEFNGMWARRYADGTWRPYRNAYQQALDAKFAIRDALRAWNSHISAYPSGEVVFIPAIPNESALTAGDHKVAVRDLHSFLKGLPTAGPADIPLSTWRAFASHLKLERVDPAQLRLTDDAATAETLRNYRLAFEAQYGPTAQSWLPEDEAQLTALLGAADGAGVHLSGPSGCGKSLMAHRLAIALSDQGHPVILVAGKDVADSWRDTVRREIGLLVDGRPDEILGALRKAQRPLALVVDGVNEIRGDRKDAVRGVLAMARRYEAVLIVTDQTAAGDAFAGLSPIEVPQPSLNLKRRIASAGSPTAGPIDRALEAVSSGLEASLIGRVKTALPAGTTRLQLLERYARDRLGARARKGALGLRRLATKLHADTAYSLPEVAFDEYMNAQGLDASEVDALLASGLVVRRADRISFRHEMFLTTFAAFDLAAIAAERPQETGQSLSTPRYRSMAGDIVSAIDDADTCRAVLESTTNAALLASAVERELGPLAASAAATLLRQAAETCMEEIDACRLELNPEGKHPQVDWADTSRRSWSDEEKARLQAIGETATGASFDLYMELCARMDALREAEWRRLLDDARQLKVSVRSESFALAYYYFGKSTGFSSVRHTGPRSSNGRPHRRVAVADLRGLTSGQLHFVLEARYALLRDDDAEAFAAFLTEVFGHRYRFEPYHVRLALLNAAGFVRDVSEDTKAGLIAAIEGLETNQNWALDSSIIDALKFLGALDDEAEAQREGITAEVRQALAEPETEELCAQALSLCVRMFDHPFDSIYWEEIGALDEADGHTLLRRAASAPDAHQSLSLTWVIERVVELADPRDGPRLQRFANLPSRRTVFPQEEWGAFLLVTRFFGRHGLELPEGENETPTEICLTALRSLVHACESQNRDVAQRAWRQINEAEIGVAVGCLSEVQRALLDRHTLEDSKSYPRLSLIERFPTESLALSRAFLDGGLAAIYHHRAVDRGSGVGLALQCVAELGDRSDIPRVRALTGGGSFAQVALEALKILDEGKSATSGAPQ
ncbi:MAG: NERD domain-containing protein [Phenylobacterium sp.]|nr:NERD domain-containing protein [Phenylobacterium sp.]